MTLVRINAAVPWAVTRGKGGAWVGVCEPLKLTIQSPTWTDLMEDIGHTLDAILQDLLAGNEFDKFLRDQGWTLVSPLPSKPKNIRFDVPFIPAVMGAHGSSRELHQ